MYMYTCIDFFYMHDKAIVMPKSILYFYSYILINIFFYYRFIMSLYIILINVQHIMLKGVDARIVIKLQ